MFWWWSMNPEHMKWLNHRNKVRSDPLLVWANKTESSPRSRCEETISIRGNGPYFLTSLRAHIREPFMWRLHPHLCKWLSFNDIHDNPTFWKRSRIPSWVNHHNAKGQQNMLDLQNIRNNACRPLAQQQTWGQRRGATGGGAPIKRPAYNLYKIT